MDLEPSALRRLRAQDPALADRLQDDFGRLLRAGEAMAWAQAQLSRLVHAGSVTSLLRVLVDEARALTGVAGAWALAWSGDLERPTIEALAVSGDSPDIRAMPAPDVISQTVVGQVIREGRPAWSDDALQDTRFVGAESVQAIHVRSLGCLPIGRSGVLYLHDPQRPGVLEPSHKARLSALCTLAGPFLDPGEAPSGPRSSAERPPAIPGLVGDAPAMDELRFAITAFAPMPWPALILGETGTGKERVALALHELSLNRAHPFVPINCGAIPESLAESLLFGHEKGAFTGADRRKPGVVERVGAGTLFLDEVGELPATVQVKLLRLLQEGTFERVGGDTIHRFEGRVIAATNQPIDRPGDVDGFRQDLYHRLGACVLRVPPLRDRRSDVPALAEHLLERALSEVTGEYTMTLAPEALVELRNRDWPGNVRELENAVRAAVARAIAHREATIRPAHLLGPAAPPPADDVATLPALPVDLTAATEAYQRRLVRAALAQADGKRARAAELLGVSRQWLHRLTTRWGLEG